MSKTTEKIIILEKWEQFVNDELWPDIENRIKKTELILEKLRQKQNNGTLTKQDVEIALSILSKIADDSLRTIYIAYEITEAVGGGNLFSSTLGLITHNMRDPFAFVCAELHALEGKLKDELRPDKLKKVVLPKLEKCTCLTKQYLIETMQEIFKSTEEFEDSEIIHFRKRDSSLQEAMSGVLETVLKSSPTIFWKVEIAECIDIWKDVIPYEEILRLEILYELIRNAATAMQDTDGTVILKIDKKDGVFLITVQDNGLGIPEENLSRIFEKGFTTKEGGTGLGLYYIKQLVEDIIKGSIKVESKLGRGTTFTITIPKKIKEE